MEWPCIDRPSEDWSRWDLSWQKGGIVCPLPFSGKWALGGQYWTTVKKALILASNDILLMLLLRKWAGMVVVRKCLSGKSD